MFFCSWGSHQEVFSTSTGPCGVIVAKKGDAGEHITTGETQSFRYANSTFKYKIRFAYEATGEIIHFTNQEDFKYRSGVDGNAVAYDKVKFQKHAGGYHRVKGFG